MACSAEGDAARKARLGHCDDVVCSMRLRFPDAVYLDYSFQEIAKKKWTYVWTYVWPAGVNEKLSARFFHRKLFKNKLFKKVK